MSRISMRSSVLMLVVWLVIAGRGAAQTSSVAIVIDQTGSAWADSHLYDKLSERLTRDQKIRVKECLPASERLSSCPGDNLNLERLLQKGRAAGGDYVLYIKINSERFERRKTFSVPLIFHKWEVIGVMEGEWRLVDVIRGRQTKAAPIQIEMNGKRVFQATMDDNVDDPDINMSSPAKLEFFGQLENLLAEQICGSIGGLIGKQEREYVTRPISKK